MKNEDNTQMYTRDEVARRLSVSTKTVDRLRQSGQLATKWVGENSPRIPVESLKKFLAAAGCFAFVAFAQAVEINGKLIHAVAMVESNNNHRAVGDQGKANGAFQMWKPAWTDCSRWLKKNGFKTTPYERGVNDPQIAHVYCKTYLSIIHGQLKKKMGREPTAAHLYSAYNLGVRGFERRGFKLSKTPATTQRAITKLYGFLK
jgi:hypothetical protein